MPADGNTRVGSFAKNFAIGALACVAAGLGFLLWLDQQEIQLLHAQIAAENANRKHAGGKKGSHNDDAADSTMAAEEDTTDPGAPADGKKHGGKKGENADGTQRVKPKDREGWRAYSTMVGNANFEALSKAQTNAQVGRTYALLFKSLNLAPDAQSRLQDLLTQRQQAITDAVVSARENGLKSKTAPEEFGQATTQAAAPFDAQLHQLLGDSAFGQLNQYQESIPQRNLVGQLQQRLATTNTPLSDDDATKLVQLLTAAKPIAVQDGASPILGTHSLLAGGGVAKVTDTTLAVAEQVLAPTQVQALQQIQQERTQQGDMAKLLKGKSADRIPATVGTAPPPGK